MNILFGIICFVWFVLPGVMLYRIAPTVLKNPVFIPIASWVYLAVTFAVVRILSVPVGGLPYVVYGGMAALAVWSLYRSGNGLPALERHLRRRWYVLAGGLFVVGGYSIYHLWAGVYMEIPADIYSHLDKFHSEFRGISDRGYVSKASFGGIDDIVERHWYVIYAYLTYHAGSRVEDVYPTIAYLNAVILVLSVYYVGVYVFARFKVKTHIKVLAAAASTAFFVLHFGVNVFSYVRYYSLAPTMTAYVVFLGTIIVSQEFFRGSISSRNYCFILGVMTLTAAMLHLQEAIFTVLAAWGMAVVLFIQLRIGGNEIGVRGASNRFDRGRAIKWSRVRFVAVSGICLGLIAVIVSLIMLERNVPGRPWVESLSMYLPFVKHLFILNPRYQVFHVLAVWGYVVYILFFFRVREFSQGPFILAGMIVVPLATVMNPVFVDFYLRHEDPYTLYRMLYVIPLFYAGGYLFVIFCRDVVCPGGLPRRLVSAAVAVLLVVVVWPFDVLYAENQYSRIHTLKLTYTQGFPNHWGDLIEKLREIGEERIVTDPVTGYVVNGTTKHQVRTRKYRKVWIELDDQAYEDDREMFADYDGYLLIINLRGGGLSETGQLSGHWPADVLDTGKHYSEGLIRYVTTQTEMFLSLWERDGISIYRIRYVEESSADDLQYRTEGA